MQESANTKGQDPQANSQGYKLYAGEIQEVPQNAKYSLIPSHHQYLLIYSDTPPEPQEDFVCIDNFATEFTAEEMMWLAKCKMQVNAEEVKRNREAMEQLLDSFLDVFEQELATEAEKQKTQTTVKSTKTASGRGNRNGRNAKQGAQKADGNVNGAQNAADN